MAAMLYLDYAALKYLPSPAVIQAIKAAIERVNEYPDETYARLKEVLARAFGVPTDYFLIGNGLDEVIDIVTRAFVRQGESVVIPIPTFSQFEGAAKRQRARPIFVRCMCGNEFSLDPEKVLAAIEQDTRIIWICSPNNPTGTIVPVEDIERIVSNTETLVVVDEALLGLSGSSALNLVERYDNLLVLKSLSKTYGLAGLRVGFAIGNPETLALIATMKQIFNVNRLAVEGAIAALEDRGYYKRIWREIDGEKQRVISSVEGIGIPIVGKESNILLLDFSDRERSNAVYEALLQRGIKVFPGWNPEFTGLDGRFLRVVVSVPEENDTFLKALNAIVGGDAK